MDCMLIIFAFVFGACFGSFFCCQARRLHLKEGNGKRLPSRSVCLSCRYQLKWYDNIPILSWVLLRGRCRKCHRPIGVAELLSELGTGLAMALVSVAFLGAQLGLGSRGVLLGTETLPVFGLASSSPALHWAVFVSTLFLVLSLCFLAIYDGLYGTLPVFALTISMVCAIILVILRSWSFFSVSGFSVELIIQPLLGALMLGGVYLVLYFFSHGRWVGDGDWILGAIIGLGLGSPWLALIALFLANLLATIIMLPLVSRRGHVIYLGPFLVAGYICTLVVSCAIIVV